MIGVGLFIVSRSNLAKWMRVRFHSLCSFQFKFDGLIIIWIWWIWSLRNRSIEIQQFYFSIYCHFRKTITNYHRLIEPSLRNEHASATKLFIQEILCARRLTLNEGFTVNYDISCCESTAKHNNCHHLFYIVCWFLLADWFMLVTTNKFDSKKKNCHLNSQICRWNCLELSTETHFEWHKAIKRHQKPINISVRHRSGIRPLCFAFSWSHFVARQIWWNSF